MSWCMLWNEPTPCILRRYHVMSSAKSRLMNRADHLHETEIALGAESREKAEAERKNVNADHLAATVTEFIEWRAFSYWLRLIVEKIGFVPHAVETILQERCPGFLEYSAAYAREHASEEEFLWLRFLEWTDDTRFHAAIIEGWRHVLGYDAMRDPRMDQLRAFWRRCRESWEHPAPASFPNYESWRASAFQTH